MQQFGHVLFIFGVLIAFVAGLGYEHPWLQISLALFGVFVGLVNIAAADTLRFLITGIALGVSALAFEQFAFIGAALSGVMVFVGGALLVVAVRVLFGTALSTLWKNPR